MIPKIIHYCWFGEREIPSGLKLCMKSWEILEKQGYSFQRWDETNCSFNENDFVRLAFKEKRWGFIGDYYRFKALYEYGGIYLDTDVVINRSFDDLLDKKAFIGYMYECALETAVIGAEKNSTFIKKYYQCMKKPSIHHMRV